MKKIITILLVALFATTAFAQLQVTGTSKYSTVYSYNPSGTYLIAEVRYIENEYVLFGTSDNRFENTMHSIILGKTKDEAVQSLNELEKLYKTLGKGESIRVKGFGDKETTISKSGMYLSFKTDYIVGESYALPNLKYKKIVKAINDFIE